MHIDNYFLISSTIYVSYCALSVSAADLLLYLNHCRPGWIGPLTSAGSQGLLHKTNINTLTTFLGQSIRRISAMCKDCMINHL